MLFKKNYYIDDIPKKTNNYKKIIIPIIIIILITLLLVFCINKPNKSKQVNNNNYYIDLTGDSEIIIYQFSEYIEPGYNGYDDNSLDLTDKVVVSTDLDTQNIGSYTITYTLNNTKKQRNINVIEKPIGATYIYLFGESKIILEKNAKYIEPGYEVVDSVDGILTDKVEVINNVDTSKPGVYNVIYSVVNSSNVTTQEKRIVVVVGEELSLSLSDTNYTNKTIYINAHTIDPYFDYITLPNGNTIDSSNYQYAVSSNGTYKFISHNKLGKTSEATIKVTNIDKTKPTGSCLLTINDTYAKITIQAKDNIGISHYKYLSKTYQNNTINVSTNTTSASITIYDVSGNSTQIECSKKNNKTNSSTTKPTTPTKPTEPEQPKKEEQPTKQKMDGYIFIGDSRTVGMSQALGSSKPSNVYIVAKNSMGYNWLINSAISEVNSILNKNPNKRFYIYSNLGINDYTYQTSYATKLNELANGSWSKHKVVFISVNPYAGTNYPSENKKVTNFNNNQKSKLNNVYYCDTYNGIGQSNFSCGWDCIHYNNSTYLKIYNYVIKNCSF